MTTPALLPCPFCGGTDVSIGTDFGNSIAYVACGNCDAQGPSAGFTKVSSEKQDAARYWNQRSAWQPIETAPGDGTEVFVWDGAKAVAAVSERDFVGDVIHWPVDEWGDKICDQGPVYPTHWQPLPSPPPITP